MSQGLSYTDNKRGLSPLTGRGYPGVARSSIWETCLGNRVAGTSSLRHTRVSRKGGSPVDVHYRDCESGFKTPYREITPCNPTQRRASPRS